MGTWGKSQATEPARHISLLYRSVQEVSEGAEACNADPGSLVPTPLSEDERLMPTDHLCLSKVSEGQESKCTAYQALTTTILAVSPWRSHPSHPKLI